MPGNRESGAAWRHTNVVLRSDIYQRALDRGIDISDACNRALADLTGTAYSPKVPEEKPAPPPVIIAKDGAIPRIPEKLQTIPSGNLHPVINADDPAAPAKVVRGKTTGGKTPAAARAPVPVPEPVREPEAPREQPAGPAALPGKKGAAGKSRAALPKKRSKGDALKSFFAEKISRTGDTGDSVGKDVLYDLFARFCREHRIAPVPDRKAVTIALKNQFALTEKAVAGTPSWTGIRPI